MRLRVELTASFCEDEAAGTFPISQRPLFIGFCQLQVRAKADEK
jgi:hypothetical protein